MILPLMIEKLTSKKGMDYILIFSIDCPVQTTRATCRFPVMADYRLNSRVHLHPL